MLIKKKNAVIGAQFNWVFILLVGGIIFLFFITFSNNVKKNSNMVVDAGLLSHLDSIAKGASLSIGTVYDIEMPPGKTLQSTCEDSILTFYKSGLEGIILPYNVFFSSQLLTGTKLFTYSNYWSEPFPVTPFLYMTTDRTLFFVINDSNTEQALELFDEIPVNGKDDTVDENGNALSTLKYNKNTTFLEELLDTSIGDYDYIKIIFLGDISSDIFDLFTGKSFKSKVQVYEIKPKTTPISFENDQIFDVTYYNLINGDGLETDDTTRVLGLPSLLGIIFSDSIADYKCNMRKALLKYQIMLKLYASKVNTLKGYVENKSDDYSMKCLNFYDSHKYEEINNYVNQSLQNNNLNLAYLDNIASIVTTLNNLNNNLGDASCPVQY